MLHSVFLIQISLYLCQVGHYKSRQEVQEYMIVVSSLRLKHNKE